METVEVATPYTEQELSDLRKEACDAQISISQAKHDLELAKLTYKESIEKPAKTFKSSLKQIQKGKKVVEVDCFLDYDYDARTVILTDAETGEYVQTRPMRANEQMQLHSLNKVSNG